MIYEDDQQFLDNNGDPLASGTVGFYVDGDTATLKTVYTTSTRDVTATNPQTLDAAGRLTQAIHGIIGASYSVVKKDSDAVIVATTDGVPDLEGLAYDVAGFFEGIPGDSQLILLFVADRAFTLPQDLTGSVAYANTDAAVNATVSITVNEVSKGTADYAAGDNFGTFTFASAVNIVANDRIRLIAQSSADADLADIAITLKGTLA